MHSTLPARATSARAVAVVPVVARARGLARGRARLQARGLARGLARGGAAVRATALAPAVLLLAALTTAPADVARAQTARDFSGQMERPEVRDVTIRGTKALDDGDVADALATRASGCLSLAFYPFCLFTKSPYVYQRRYLDREEFERDVVRLLVFYYKRGYRDAAVDTTVARAGRNAVNVTFTVREGRPTRTARVTVEDPTDRLRPRDRARLLSPAPGEPFNTLRLDSAVLRVREAYFDRGYGNAQVGPAVLQVDDSADTAAARIPAVPGPLTPIGRIDVVHLGGRRACATSRSATRSRSSRATCSAAATWRGRSARSTSRGSSARRSSTRRWPRSRGAGRRCARRRRPRRRRSRPTPRARRARRPRRRPRTA
jgi:hypothetical protein